MFLMCPHAAAANRPLCGDRALSGGSGDVSQQDRAWHGGRGEVSAHDRAQQLFGDLPGLGRAPQLHGDLHQRDRALHADLPQRDRALHAELPLRDRAWHGDLPPHDRALHGELHPGRALHGDDAVLHGRQDLLHEGGPHGGVQHGGVQGHGSMGVAPMPTSWEASGGGGGGKAELPVLPNGASPLEFGDWLCLCGPIMKDLSHVAGRWWDATVRQAYAFYMEWKGLSPLQRVQLCPRLPDETDGRRLHQNGAEGRHFVAQGGERRAAEGVGGGSRFDQYGNFVPPLCAASTRRTR